MRVLQVVRLAHDPTTEFIDMRGYGAEMPDKFELNAVNGNLSSRAPLYSSNLVQYKYAPYSADFVAWTHLAKTTQITCNAPHQSNINDAYFATSGVHSKAAIFLPSNVSVGDTIKFAYDGMTYTTFVRDIVPVPDASFHMVWHTIGYVRAPKQSELIWITNSAARRKLHRASVNESERERVKPHTFPLTS